MAHPDPSPEAGEDARAVTSEGSGRLRLTDAQRVLLEDKFVLWERASRSGEAEWRDYNRRAAEAMKTALAICSEAP